MIELNSRILVVDDMRAMRRVVMKILTELGYTNVKEADDGATAWVAIEQALALNTPFQFIISDWNMPQLKGVELLKKVRAHATMKATPFLLVTAETEMSQVSEAVKAGVSGYITKPFKPETLKEKIQKLQVPKAA